MTYQTVELPLQEAITLEVKQNMERDRRVMGAAEVPDEDEGIYREEAEHLLTTTGEGYYPEFDDHKLVRVKH